MKKTGIFLLLIFSFSTSVLSQINYELRMPNPEQHYFKISILIKNNSEKQLNFVLPAWSPGRYTINDFAKNVINVSAVSNGKPLPIEKTDKQTWQIQTGSSNDVTLSYDVYANNLNGTFSVLDADHANYNGASIFMFLDGGRNKKVSLKIFPFGDWNVYNGYSSSENQTEFEFSNYDMMIDTPTEIGKFIIHQFSVSGKKYRIMLNNEIGDTTGASVFFADVEKIVKTQHSFMPKLDLTQYTFLVSFSKKPTTFSDGMEHLNSTQVIIKGEVSNPASIKSALGTISHEHFHVWNVKRLRPEGVGPHELKKELYTKSLWFSEGFTEYYELISLTRSGIYSLQDFRSSAEGYISGYLLNYGRKLRSVEQSSWDTWFWRSNSNETDFTDQWYSYYSQGMVLGLLIDLKLRKDSEGKISLDDLMTFMYNKYYESEKGDWYYKGKGFKENEILESLEKISGKSWKEFWKDYIEGTKELNFNDLLPFAGLNLETAEFKTFDLGWKTSANDKGFLIIKDMMPGSDAEKADFQTGDVIIAINGISVINKPIKEILPEYGTGKTISVLISRNGIIIEKKVALNQPEIKYELKIVDETNKNLKNWLKL